MIAGVCVNRLFFFLLPLMLIATAVPVWAQHHRPPPRGAGAEHPPVRDAGGMSAAVRRVERATGGQVLGVEVMRFEGREIHRVKVLTPGGRVVVVVDDPASRRPPRLPEFSPTRRDDTD